MNMKQATIIRIIIMVMLASALVVTCIAYSVAWFSMEMATPYQFEINANGVLYVYVPVKVLDNDAGLVPAVAMPGAISEGLPYDVLTVYNAMDDNPSYIEKAASVTAIKGSFDVYNEGYAYEKVPLPVDEDGYVLYPKLEKTYDSTPSGDPSVDYRIVWINDDDHSQGWQTMRVVDSWVAGGQYVYPVYRTGVDYEPLLSPSGQILWKSDATVSYDTNGGTGEYYTFSSADYNCREVVVEGSSECEVTVRVGFKASDNNELDDYYDNRNFGVKRIYITKEDEEIADGVGMGAIYGNSGVPLTYQSADKKEVKFAMFGAETYFLHVEAYIAQPDELFDPALRGHYVYMSVNVSVAVTQFGS